MRKKAAVDVSYEFDWLPLGELFVDSYQDSNGALLPDEARIAYQRRVQKIKRSIIANGVNPDLFGTLVVNRRPTGRYAVVDGGSRYAALQELEYHPESKVPCLVHEWNHGDEVRNYLAWNIERQGLNQVDKFIGRLRIGDKEAQHMEELLQEITGMGVHPGQWACIYHLEHCYKRDEGKTLEKVLRLQVHLGWHLMPRGRTQNIIGALDFLITDGVKEKVALKRWADISPNDAIEAGKQALKKINLIIVPAGKGEGSRQTSRGVAFFLGEKYNYRLGRASKDRIPMSFI